MPNKKILLVTIAAIFSIALIRYAHYAPKRNYSDFRAYYATAERFIQKEPIYTHPDLPVAPYKYPPFFALLLAPLALLPKFAAGILFFSINFLCLILFIKFTSDLITLSSLSPGKQTAVITLAVLCCYRFILQVLYVGQASLIMYTLCTAALVCLKKNKTLPAAALIAASMSIKYLPVLFLPYFLIRKRWKLCGWILLFFAGLNLLPAIYVGPQSYLQDMKNWTPFVLEASLDRLSLYHFKNQSFTSMILRFFTADTPYRACMIPLTFTQGRLLANALAILLATWVLIPGHRKHPEPLQIASLFVLMPLLNPNGWMLNYTALLFAYAAALRVIISNPLKHKLPAALTALSFAMASLPSETLVGNHYENVAEEMSFITLGALTLLAALAVLKKKGG